MKKRTKQIKVYMSDHMRDIVTRDCHFRNDKSLSSTYHTDTPHEGILTVNLPIRKTIITEEELDNMLSDFNENDTSKFDDSQTEYLRHKLFEIKK